jgi:hypothetical protein
MRTKARLVLGVVAVVVMLGAVSTASASIHTWFDFDAIGGKLVSVSDPASPVIGVFNITETNNDGDGDSVGFRPGVDLALLARVEIKARDDGDRPLEAMSLELDGLWVGSSFSMSFAWPSILNPIGELLLVGDINTDGIVNYEIQAACGDFYVDSAKLCVEGLRCDVPEPATIVIWSLLGGIAITAGRRRHQKAA